MILSREAVVDLAFIPKVSDCFHLQTLISDDIFLTEDGSIGSAFLVEGVDESLFSQTASDEAHMAWQRAIQALNQYCVIQVMQSQNRCQQLPEETSDKKEIDPTRDLRNDFQKVLLKKGLHDSHAYVFLWYRKKKNKQKELFSSFRQKNKLHKEVSSRLEEFSHIRKQFECQMKAFKCELLGVPHQIDDMIYAISLAVNGGGVSYADSNRKKELLSAYVDLSSLLAKYHITIAGNISFSSGNEKHYASVLSLNHYPATTSAGCCCVLGDTQATVIKLDTFIPMSQSEAGSRLNRTLAKYETSEDKAIDHVAAIRSAMVSIAQDDIALGLHQQSIMLVSSDETNLSELVNYVKAAYANQGSSVIEERLGLPLAFWSFCPGGFRYLSRLVPITSKNFSDLCSLKRQPRSHHGYAAFLGKPKPLAWLRTRANTAYQFNCHMEGGDKKVPLGHTLIIGGSGSGKTVFLAWLSAQLRQYEGRLFYFDRDQSAHAYFDRMNALCLILKPETGLHLNPFSLADSVEHRLFLQFWISTLCDEELLQPEDYHAIKFSVDYVYDELKQKNRCLSAAASVLPVNFSCWYSLSRWLDSSEHREKGEYADLLSSEEDSLQLQDFVYIDISFLLDSEDSSLMRVILSYVFYRIEQEMGKGLSSILLDEAWAYLKDPFWCRRFKQWLPTLRKKHAHVVMATQSVKHITQSDACSAVLDNMATTVYFKQPMANVSDYQHQLHLSEKEFKVIKHELRSKEVLVKQGKDSVIVELDLSEMPYFLSLLQGELLC